jgi:hypothetical protein
MAYPDKYNRIFSFTDDEAEHPSTMFPVVPAGTVAQAQRIAAGYERSL